MSRKIPKADGAFNTYINTTADYLGEGTPTHGERLGLTTTELTEWEDRRNDWSLIFAKHGDASKRTKTVTAEKDLQKKAFTQFANPLLTRMGVSPALTSDDRGSLNLPERDVPTERAYMPDPPYAMLAPKTGGAMDVRVRTTADGNRASKHPDADHVEMRYALVDQTGTPAPGPGDPHTPPPTPGNPSTVQAPTTADQCPFSAISRKAIFTVAMGQANSGKRVHAFFRWVNSSKLAHSSPWSMAVQSVVV